MNQIIAEESGTFVRRHQPRQHNGYYAGDFSAVPFQAPDLSFLLELENAA
jgi:hypothetical protein